MSETDPRETKGLPDAVGEEANAVRQMHGDSRRSRIRSDQGNEIEKLDPVADEADAPVKTDVGRMKEGETARSRSGDPTMPDVKEDVA